jgi:hypothetical protein
MMLDIDGIQAVTIPVNALDFVPQRQRAANIRAQDIAVSKHRGALLVREEFREPRPEVPRF